MNQPFEKKTWFPAKRYGWGWGPPTCWQGWMVLTLFVLFLAVAAFLFISKYLWLYLLVSCILTAVLIGVGYLKGEKPAWRWGKK
jgi:hypothetical protein